MSAKDQSSVAEAVDNISLLSSVYHSQHRNTPVGQQYIDRQTDRQTDRHRDRQTNLPLRQMFQWRHWRQTRKHPG